ncbi:MAG TPA: efflux RND transporter periplasmic adaptor subunit [Bryobacteraceae bacterium]|nr:efflux RND transporter periplasmic adaptor subunit [Bryobacteraceae bacterium]
MKRKWKITLLIVVPLLIAGGVFGGMRWSQRDLVTVQTGAVTRGDLTSVVTASGEVKPRNYINIGANAQGRIVDLLVREGDHVRKNQVVARIEHVQAQADVTAQKAMVASSQADSAAAEQGIRVADESIKTAEATLEKSRNEQRRSKMLLDNAEKMFGYNLIAKQDLDQRRADYDSATATIRENEARLQQMKVQRQQTSAQLNSVQRRVAQVEAGLSRIEDVLAKYDALAPLDGVVTDLPVRVGETVVPGVQNSAASTIMTIADMSLITAEVKVDETDIVNVHLGQVANITIDAMPNRTFTGKVIDIGNTAILRSSGLAASQSANSSQEAKDFKVVIALDSPPQEIRPGLSCSAKIVTATRKNVLSIPIQALTVRKKGDLDAPKEGVQASTELVPDKSRNEEIQGVFAIRDGHAEYRKVETGITGATDIEVLSGLSDGDQILTGSYKVIRTIRNQARVKVDNRPPVLADAKP